MERKPKTRNQPLATGIGLRLSQEDQQAVLKIAEEEGSNWSSVVRSAVSQYLAAKNQIKKSPEAA